MDERSRYEVRTCECREVESRPGEWARWSVLLVCVCVRDHFSNTKQIPSRPCKARRLQTDRRTFRLSSQHGSHGVSHCLSRRAIFHFFIHHFTRRFLTRHHSRDRHSLRPDSRHWQAWLAHNWDRFCTHHDHRSVTVLSCVACPSEARMRVRRRLGRSHASPVSDARSHSIPDAKQGRNGRQPVCGWLVDARQ